ncbi:MAG: oligopeptide/dipeptide ABC transporter ATP-binding protein [Halorhabdus sp.]
MSTDESGDDEPLLSLDDVKIHFKPGGVIRSRLSEEVVRAVDGVSLEIEEEDVVALVGESGCGKTTLGKAAVALQRPTEGSVTYRGQDVWDAKDGKGDPDIPYSEIRQALQIVHQDPSGALNDSRRVRAALADPLKKWRTELDPDERLETIYKYLEYVGMTPVEDYADRFPHQLSGGEQQRVVLGRALLANPDLVLADEAVSALDVSLRVEMMDLVLELQEMFGTSYVFVSHDLANARYLTKKADGKIAVMYLGDIVEIGGPDEILENPTHPYTKVLKWSTPPADPEIAKDTMHLQPPVRRIDIPDPEDPPSGCKFHTRCEEAREACKHEDPELYDADGTEAACFRAIDDHEYWHSEELTDREELGFTSSQNDSAADD